MHISSKLNPCEYDYHARSFEGSTKTIALMAEATKAEPLAPTLLPGEVVIDVVGGVFNLLPSSSVRGTLCLTTYRVVFTPADPSLSSMIRHPNAATLSSKMRRPSVAAPISINIHPSVATFELPLAVIDTIERNESVLTLTCKDTRLIRLDLGDKLRMTPRMINLLMMKMRPPSMVSAQFAFDYSPELKKANVPKDDTAKTNGWLVYSQITDYTRLGFLKATTGNSGFRLLRNSKFRFVPTYPHLMIVPSELNEDQLIQAARMRVCARLPVAIWRHPVNNSVLVRSSDPTYGLFRKRSAADELLLRCYRDAANGARDNAVPLYIMYVRAASLMTPGGRIGGKGTRSLLFARWTILATVLTYVALLRS